MGTHRNGKSAAQRVPPRSIPGWFPIAGAIAAFLTLGFFMYLVTRPQIINCQFAVVVLALGAAMASSFLGGWAIAQGHLPFIPMATNPIQVSIGGGMAVLLIILFTGPHLINCKQVSGPDRQPWSVQFLFPGDWRVGARDGGVTRDFLLTPVKCVAVPGGSVRVDKISLSATPIGGERFPFGFDSHVILSADDESVSSPGNHTVVWSDQDEITRQIERAEGARLHIVTRTGWQPNPTDTRVSIWSYDRNNPAVEVKSAISLEALSLPDSKICGQLYIWSAWGGDPHLEVRDLRLRVSGFVTSQ